MVCLTKPSGRSLLETFWKRSGTWLTQNLTWQVIGWTVYHRLSRANFSQSGQRTISHSQTLTNIFSSSDVTHASNIYAKSPLLILSKQSLLTQSLAHAVVADGVLRWVLTWSCPGERTCCAVDHAKLHSVFTTCKLQKRTNMCYVCM